jgi:hypothetical protein
LKKAPFVSVLLILICIGFGFRFFSEEITPNKTPNSELSETQAEKEHRLFPFAAPPPSDVNSESSVGKVPTTQIGTTPIGSYLQFLNLSDKARLGDPKAAIEAFKLAHRCDVEQWLINESKKNTAPEQFNDYEKSVAQHKMQLGQWECERFTAKQIEYSKDLIEAAVARADREAALMSLTSIGMRGLAQTFGPYGLSQPNPVKEAAYELASYDIEGRTVNNTNKLTKIERLYQVRLNPTQAETANSLRRQIVAACCK